MYTLGTVYRVYSDDPVTIINGYKYRESVGRNKSQLIFFKNTYPKTHQSVDLYDDFTLIRDNHWWNLYSNNTFIQLYEHNIILNEHNNILGIDKTYNFI